MKHIGYISIQGNKIVFVYKFRKPNKKDYWSYESQIRWFEEELFDKAMQEYEASKREVEVSNRLYYPLGFQLIRLKNENKPIPFKNNQPCEAEVENNKATITKIT